MRIDPTYVVDVWYPIRQIWVRLGDTEVLRCGIHYDIHLQSDDWEVALRERAGLERCGDAGMMLRLIRHFRSQLQPPGVNQMLCAAWSLDKDRVHWTRIYAAPLKPSLHWRPYWVRSVRFT